MLSCLQMADVQLADVQDGDSLYVWDHSHTMEIWFPITTLLLDGTKWVRAHTHTHTHTHTNTYWIEEVSRLLFLPGCLLRRGQSPVLCGERLRLRKRLVSEPRVAAKHDLEPLWSVPALKVTAARGVSFFSRLLLFIISILDRNVT